jgi:hypothetical protein
LGWRLDRIGTQTHKETSQKLYSGSKRQCAVTTIHDCGLPVLITWRPVLAGASAPGRVNNARQIAGYGPDERSP